MRRRVEVRGDRPQDRVAHGRQKLIVRNVSWADQFDSGFIQTPLHKLLGERASLDGWHEYKYRLRGRVARTLQERGEVWILQRHADEFRDLSPSCQITAFENCLGLVTRTKLRPPPHRLLHA